MFPFHAAVHAGPPKRTIHLHIEKALRYASAHLAVNPRVVSRKLAKWLTSAGVFLHAPVVMAQAMSSADVRENMGFAGPDAHVKDDEWSSTRAGFHAGLHIGLTYLRFLAADQIKDRLGVSTGVFVQWGLTPYLDLRMGLSGDASGSERSFLSAGIPVGLRLSLGQVYSAYVGGAAGVMTDTVRGFFFAGPDISLLTYRFGRLREFELSFRNALRFHLARDPDYPSRTHLQSTIMLSYTYFDHQAIQPRFSARRACAAPHGLHRACPDGG